MRASSTFAREHSHGKSGAFPWILLLIALLTPKQAQSDQQTSEPLKIVGGHLLIADPSCLPAEGQLVQPITLVNGGSEPVDVNLSASEFEADNKGKYPACAIALEGSLAGAAVLGPGGTLTGRACVTGEFPEGSWRWHLLNGGKELGLFTIVVPSGAFNVAPDIATDTVLRMERASPSQLLLKNSDDVSHKASWTLSLNGKSLPYQNIELPRSNGAVIIIRAPAEWFTSPVRGLLKDEPADAWLTVGLRSPNCPHGGAIAKTFKIKSQLGYYSKSVQDFWSFFVVFLFLLVGGLFSLVLNFAIPQTLQRNRMRQQSRDLENRTAGLPLALASRLRVLAGTERRSLDARLQKLQWFSAEFALQVADLTTGLGRLEKRVTALEALGILRVRFEKLDDCGAAPSILKEIEDRFEDLVNQLGKLRLTDDDLQTSQVGIAQLEKSIGSWHQPDTALANRIVDRLKRLNQDLRGSTTLKPWAPRVSSLAKVWVDDLALATGLPSPEEYFLLDVLAFRLERISEYAERELMPGYQGSDRSGELLGYLRGDSWKVLQCAQRLMSEIGEGIFPAQIARAISGKSVKIRKDRSNVRQFEPTDFHISFDETGLNTATALEEFKCHWDFGHPEQDHLEETTVPTAGSRPRVGVSHYFPEPGTYKIIARFDYAGPGAAIDPQEVPQTISVLPERDVRPQPPWVDRHWISRYLYRRALMVWDNKLSLARLFLALVPAILALIAGAKEQLLKMDLGLALGAIFLLGFGSDQIKNVLSQPSAEVPAKK